MKGKVCTILKVDHDEATVRQVSFQISDSVDLLSSYAHLFSRCVAAFALEIDRKRIHSSARAFSIAEYNKSNEMNNV